MMLSNRNLLFQGAPIFRGERLVSGRVEILCLMKDEGFRQGIGYLEDGLPGRTDMYYMYSMLCMLSRLSLQAAEWVSTYIFGDNISSFENDSNLAGNLGDFHNFSMFFFFCFFESNGLLPTCTLCVFEATKNRGSLFGAHPQVAHLCRCCF